MLLLKYARFATAALAKINYGHGGWGGGQFKSL
jgi:hypothetical protein